MTSTGVGSWAFNLAFRFYLQHWQSQLNKSVLRRRKWHLFPSAVCFYSSITQNFHTRSCGLSSAELISLLPRGHRPCHGVFAGAAFSSPWPRSCFLHDVLSLCFCSWLLPLPHLVLHLTYLPLAQLLWIVIHPLMCVWLSKGLCSGRSSCFSVSLVNRTESLTWQIFSECFLMLLLLLLLLILLKKNENLGGTWFCCFSDHLG